MNIVESLQNLENKLFEEKDEYHDLVGALLQKPDAKSMIMEMIENNDIEGIIKCLEEDYIVEDADDYDEWTDEDNDIFNRWAFVKSKSVKDIDGFFTDYSMWREIEDGAATDHFVFIFGDSDIYNPENSDFDWECDSTEEAEEWFDNYSGFEEDDEYEDWHDTADQEQVDQPDYVPERVEDDMNAGSWYESLSWENDYEDGFNPLANKTLPTNDLGTMTPDQLDSVEGKRDRLWQKEDDGTITPEEEEELKELTRKIEDHYAKKRELMGESKNSSTITWPNGMPVSDLDLFKALQYNFGTDVVKKESDINDYTDEEKQRSVDYYAQFDLDESLKESEGPTKDDIIDWLSEHDQAWEDACDWFGSADLSEIDYDDIISWIFDHDMLSDDLMRHFGKEYFTEGCKEGSDLTESALGEDKIYIHKGDVQFNDGSTKFYELKTIAPSDLKARNNFRYQVCIDMFQDVNPFNLSRIYIPFDNISEFTLEEIPEEEIEKIDDGVQLSMFDKEEEI